MRIVEMETVKPVVPNPDPTLRTMDLVERAILNLKDLLEVRFGGVDQRFASLDKGIAIVKDDTVRVPTLLDRAIVGLHDVVQGEISVILEKSNGSISLLDERIARLSEVSEERFKSIQTQFTLLGKATEQLDIANKTAIAAALQAQKESAGETQKTSQAAIAKSENSTSEAIRTLTATLQQQFTAATDRVNDLKSRLDRGEGGRNIIDPAVAESLQNKARAIASLESSTHIAEGKQAGKDYTMTIVLTLIGIATPAIALMMVIISKLH